MTSNEFLNELKKELEGKADEREIADISEYYEDYIAGALEDGWNEEQVLAELGGPVDVARQILKDRGLRITAEGKNADKAKAKSETVTFSKSFPAAGYDMLKVDLHYNAVEVRPYEGEDIVISYQELYDGEYITSEDGRKLSFTQPKPTFSMFFRFRFMFGKRNAPVKIRVPRDCKFDMYIKSSNSRALAEDISVKSLVLKSSNGAVKGENLSGGSIEAKTSNGSVSLRGVSADSLTAASKNGSVKVSLVKGLNSAMCENLELSSSNGAVTLDSADAKSISATSNNGAVKLLSLSGQVDDYELELNTKNGGFKINGEKARQRFTRVAAGSTSRRINARTENGSVTIETKER